MRIFGDLLRLSRCQTKYSGIGALLNEIANHCGANGIVLWRLRKEPSSNEYLYAASSHFQESGEPLFQDLGEDSLAAVALKQHQIQQMRGEGLETGGGRLIDWDLLRRYRVERHVTVPVYRDHGQKEPYGCLTVTFPEDTPSQPEQLHQLQLLSTVFPVLADTLSETVTDRLVEIINQIQVDFSREQTAKDRVRPWDPLVEAFKRIGEEISQAFEALEYGIYLRKEDNGPAKRFANTWPWTSRQVREAYQPGEGASGYCLLKAIPVHIEDVLTYWQRPDRYERYVGLRPTWSTEDVRAAVAELIKPHSVTKALPPVPFVCFPLKDGKRTLGFLRLCGVRRAPFCLDEHQINGLSRVSLVLAHWAGSRMRFQQIKELEHRASLVIRMVTRLTEALTGSTESLASEDALIRSVTDTLFGLGTAIDVAMFRVLDASEQRWTLTKRFSWTRESYPTLPALPAEISFDPRRPARYAPWAEVLNKSKLHSIGDTQSPESNCSDLALRSVLIAPVMGSATRAIGTLELYSLEPRVFSPSTVESLRLVAAALSLIVRTLRAIRSERNLRELHERETKEIREGLENLQHQLKAPVRLAKQQLDFLLRYNPGLPVEDDLRDIQAAARRAHQVVNRVEIYTAIAREEEIRLMDVVTLKREPFLARLQEACDLFSVDIAPDRGVGFHVRREAFLPLDSLVVRADLSLVDQVLDILLDNAVKYGQDHSTIEIGAGVSDRGHYFYVSVVNRGPDIPPHEVNNLKDRGKRSAKVVRSKPGAGLGLHIAKYIQWAHRGRLEVISKPGVVEVRALFPVGATE